MCVRHGLDQVEKLERGRGGSREARGCLAPALVTGGDGEVPARCGLLSLEAARTQKVSWSSLR